MFHWAYAIQNWQEEAELKELWKYIADVNKEGNKFCKFDEPVLTWWWLVGTCTTSFKDSMQQWKRICATIQNSAPLQSASYKIASCTTNLINNAAIINDLELLVAYHKSFIDP
eukprot:12149159-Ditylum_brightwellii.AAC.1